MRKVWRSRDERCDRNSVTALLGEDAATASPSKECAVTVIIHRRNLARCRGTDESQVRPTLHRDRLPLLEQRRTAALLEIQTQDQRHSAAELVTDGFTISLPDTWVYAEWLAPRWGTGRFCACIVIAVKKLIVRTFNVIAFFVIVFFLSLKVSEAFWLICQASVRSYSERELRILAGPYEQQRAGHPGDQQDAD